MAHNRKATKHDVEIVQTAFRTIVTPLGEDLFRSLVLDRTIATDISAMLRKLWEEARQSFALCKALAPMQSLQVWEEINNQWWFDSDYLNHTTDAIIEYFTLLTAYSRLPRFRGAGHGIEEWARVKQIDALFAKAEQELSTLLGDATG